MKSANQERALVALTQYPTISEAAKAVGLSRTAIYGYLAEPEFRQALQARSEAQVIERAEALAAAREAALSAVMAVMNDSTVSPAARVIAAKTVLGQATEADEAMSRILKSKAFNDEWFG